MEDLIGFNSSTLVISANVDGEVIIDERGIPHVFAEDQESALYLQGYLHARDRLFQMDVSARSAGGRLAEVLGTDLLERDRIQRRKGMVVAAQRTAAVQLDLVAPLAAGQLPKVAQRLVATVENAKQA